MAGWANRRIRRIKPEPHVTAHYEMGVPPPSFRNLHALLRETPPGGSVVINDAEESSIAHAARNVGKELGCRFSRRKTGPRAWRVWRLA